MRKIFQISGIIVLMISITACGHSAQAETVESTTVVETTVEETTTATPTTEESTETSIVEEIAVKLDLPTLSTGKTFDELNAMAYESLYNNWADSLDEETRNFLGKEGLSEMVKSSLTDFTEQEISEVTDYILTKVPVTEGSTMETIESIQKESQQQQQTKPKETQASQQQSKPKETQASQPQQTQPAQDENLTPEEQKMLENWNKLQEEIGSREQDFSLPTNGHAYHYTPEERAAEDEAWADFEMNGGL